MVHKVLFTASTFSHILNFHIPYMKWFQDQGWKVHVACGGEPVSIPYADRVIFIPLRKNMGSPDNFKAAVQLRRLILEKKYTLVSTHTSLAAFFTRLAVKEMRERPLVVNTVHGYLFDGDTPAVKRTALLLAEQVTAAQTDLLMTMNQWDFQLAQKKKLGKLVVRIPGMGVNFSELERYDTGVVTTLRRKWGIPEDAFVLLYPAEFSERKSQKVAIEALAKLPKNCVLTLPGTGTLLTECKALAGMKGLGRRVIFPGHVAKMGPWYAMADVAVTTSRSEGLPFNVIEAMYFGLPVVASKVKGHTDLIQDGVTGSLYSYGNADTCAEAIHALMCFPSIRRQMGKNAKESAEPYRLKHVLQEVSRQYGQLLPELLSGHAKV